MCRISSINSMRGVMTSQTIATFDPDTHMNMKSFSLKSTHLMWSVKKDHVPRTAFGCGSPPITCRNQLKSISIRQNLDSDVESVGPLYVLLVKTAGVFGSPQDSGAKIDKIQIGASGREELKTSRPLVAYWGIHPGNLTYSTPFWN